jgi:hypothetical protein
VIVIGFALWEADGDRDRVRIEEPVADPLYH